MIPCGHPEYVEGCPTCRWRIDPTEKGRAARRLWGLPEPKGARLSAAKPPCRHLGAETRRVLCPSCRGKVELKVFGCAAHGECTQGKPAPGVEGCCAGAGGKGCKEYTPRPFDPSAAGRVRHLLYHVYPLARDGGRVWRRNAAAVRRRLSLFNGRRVVGVATGPGAESAAAVRAELPGCDFVEVPNDPTLREMATFPILLESVSGFAGPGHATFYAHAKGVTSEAWAPPVRRWADAMYAACLDYWPAVRLLLAEFPLAGCFKRRDGFAAGQSSARWHYSGSFRWTRNADLFVRDWRRVDRNWIGSESHPALHFHPDEAGCLFGEFTHGGLGLYGVRDAAGFWERFAGPAAEEWFASHLPDRWNPLLLTCVLTSHRKPATVHEAIASVLAQSSPDWQLVVMDSGPLAEAGEFDRYRDEPRVVVAVTGETEDMRGRVCLQAWAINECFRRGLVRGDLCCHLSDDDVYDPEIFDAWLAAARQHPERGAWYGPADRCEVRPGGEVKIGELATVGPTRRLRCVADGMQICVRRSLGVEWPEAVETAHQADGVFMDAVGAKVVIHPVAQRVGRHRHTEVSAFTRPR